jgi:FkbM family methyltransferase
MKTIRFIDCGANVGQSIEWAKKTFSKYPYKIDSFEPLPLNVKVLNEKYSSQENITIHPKAISTTNSIQKFYCQNWGARTGSSLVKGKSSATDGYIDIETIDLAEWLNLNISKNEIAILKIDIEGSEYEVLPHLFKNKIHEWIDTWLVEFHPSTKVSTFNSEVINQTKANVKWLADWAIDFESADNIIKNVLK